MNDPAPPVVRKGPPAATWVVLAVTHALAFQAGHLLGGDLLWGLGAVATLAAIAALMGTLGSPR